MKRERARRGCRQSSAVPSTGRCRRAARQLRRRPGHRRTNRGCTSSRRCSPHCPRRRRTANWRSGWLHWTTCSLAASGGITTPDRSIRSRPVPALRGVRRRPREAAGQWPTVVVLEDLHWAGVQTLALLRHIARSGVPSGLLVVGTFRDTSDELNEPLATCLADLRRVGFVTRLRLEGLDEAAVERFVADAIGNPLDAGFKDLAAELRTRSGGNVFYIVELWRHLVASGAVAHAGRWVGRTGSRHDLDRSRQRSRGRRRPPRPVVAGGPGDDRDGRCRRAADRPRSVGNGTGFARRGARRTTRRARVGGAAGVGGFHRPRLRVRARPRARHGRGDGGPSRPPTRPPVRRRGHRAKSCG